MKNIKLFSFLAFFTFLAVQSCEKIKEILVITVNVPIEKCHTIIAPQDAGTYSEDATISTKTQEILTNNEVDLSAIRSATPNEVVISIGNPSETTFQLTSVKSIKVELATATKAAITIAEETIENAVVEDNIATFPADASIDLIDYIKEDQITMTVTVTTSEGVVEDTELCFELKNDMKIGIPQ